MTDKSMENTKFQFGEPMSFIEVIYKSRNDYTMGDNSQRAHFRAFRQAKHIRECLFQVIPV